MKYVTLIVTLHVLTFCWLWGAVLGSAHANHALAARDEPYRKVMEEAVADLQGWGYTVRDPSNLPPIFKCDTCLEKNEAFGAYSESMGGVILPNNFDLTTLDGHAALIHEYGHFLLTKAGMPAEDQEKICLALGNSIYQKFFTAAAN